MFNIKIDRNYNHINNGVENVHLIIVFNHNKRNKSLSKIFEFLKWLPDTTIQNVIKIIEDYNN